MKTDLHKKTGHTGAPRLKLDKKVRGESGKDKKYDVKPDLVCENLLDAVEKILKSEDR